MYLSLGDYRPCRQLVWRVKIPRYPYLYSLKSYDWLCKRIMRTGPKLHCQAWCREVAVLGRAGVVGLARHCLYTKWEHPLTRAHLIHILTESNGVGDSLSNLICNLLLLCHFIHQIMLECWCGELRYMYLYLGVYRPCRKLVLRVKIHLFIFAQ